MFINSIPQNKILSFFPSIHGVGVSYMNFDSQLIFTDMITSRKREAQKHVLRCIDYISNLAPSVVILEEYRKSRGGRKRGVSKEILSEIYAFAIKHGIRIKCYTRIDIKNVFANYNAEAKYEIATILCGIFPHLEKYKPKERLHSKHEPYSSAVFDAISLGLIYLNKKDLNFT